MDAAEGGVEAVVEEEAVYSMTSQDGLTQVNISYSILGEFSR